MHLTDSPFHRSRRRLTCANSLFRLPYHLASAAAGMLPGPAGRLWRRPRPPPTRRHHRQPGSHHRRLAGRRGGRRHGHGARVLQQAADGEHHAHQAGARRLHAQRRQRCARHGNAGPHARHAAGANQCGRDGQRRRHLCSHGTAGPGPARSGQRLERAHLPDGAARRQPPLHSRTPRPHPRSTERRPAGHALPRHQHA